MGNKDELIIWQKLLIVFAFVFLGIFIGIPASLLILTILYKLIPNNFIYTLAVAFPFIWGPILGAIFGILIGIKIVFGKKDKSHNSN